MPDAYTGVSNRYKRLLTNTAVFTVGKLLSRLLVFFMIGVYTRCLTKAEFGRAEMIVSMANLLIPLACAGISEGIFRSAAAKEGDKEGFFTGGLLVYGIGSAVFLLLSPLIGLIPVLAGSAWLVALYVVVANLHTVVSQYLCAIGRVKLFAGQGILNTALVIGLNILFLPVLDFGVTGYILATVLADLFSTVFLILVTRLWRAVKPSRVTRGMLREMLRFCLPLVPTTLCWWVTGVSDRFMVEAMCSSEMTGLYSVAYKIPNLLIYIISIFDSAWKLSVSSEEDPHSRTEFYTRVWGVYTTLTFLGSGGLMLCSRFLAGLIFSGDFGQAWVYVPTLTLATVYCILCTFLGSVFFASRRTTGSMVTAMVGAVLNLTLNVCLIPPLGAMGASLATFASYFVVSLLRLIFTRRLIPFRREWGRLTLNTLLMGGMTALVTLPEIRDVSVFGAWGGAIALYLVMLVLHFSRIRELLREAGGMLRRR